MDLGVVKLFISCFKVIFPGAFVLVSLTTLNCQTQETGLFFYFNEIVYTSKGIIIDNKNKPWIMFLLRNLIL